MRASLFLMGTQGGTYADITEQVSLAEALGFHAVWLGERYLSNGDLLWPSPSIAAAYLLARTQRIRIGLAARVLPFHHPLQVAADAATLDVFSRGRFDLGVTSGSMDDASHRAFGVERADAWGRFEESLEIVRHALRGEPFSFRGAHFVLDEVVPSPMPVQAPHFPIYMVANSPRALEFAADRGLSVFLNGALSTAEVAQLRARYDERAAITGADARAAEVLVNRFVFVGESDAHARRVVREPFLRFLHERAPDLRSYLARRFGADGLDFNFLAREICIFGSAERCAEQLHTLGERAGVRHMLITCNLITLDHELCLESMARLAHEVLPRLPASPAPCGAALGERARETAIASDFEKVQEQT